MNIKQIYTTPKCEYSIQKPFLKWVGGKTQIINNIIDKDSIYLKPQKHPKSILQEFCLHQYNTLPKYSISNKSGNEHQPVYEVSVYIKNHDVVCATGVNLKKAEEAAAKKLLNILKI